MTELIETQSPSDKEIRARIERGKARALEKFAETFAKINEDHGLVPVEKQKFNEDYIAVWPGKYGRGGKVLLPDCFIRVDSYDRVQELLKEYSEAMKKEGYGRARVHAIPASANTFPNGILYSFVSSDGDSGKWLRELVAIQVPIDESHIPREKRQHRDLR